MLEAGIFRRSARRSGTMALSPRDLRTRRAAKGLMGDDGRR
jgi:hypothetical protein